MGTKVYLLTYSDYDYMSVHGVVATEELAKSFTDRFPACDYDEYEIETVLDLPEDTSLKPYTVLCNGHGDMAARLMEEPRGGMVWAKDEDDAIRVGGRDALIRRLGPNDSPQLTRLLEEFDKAYGEA